jgi:uncharacterized membrane-anchored protein YitT (DUF2179 family)
MRRFGFGTIRQQVLRLLIVVVGALIVAVGYSLFQVPFNIAAGGVGGISIIINHFTGWPVGTLYLVINIPLMVLGFRYRCQSISLSNTYQCGSINIR